MLEHSLLILIGPSGSGKSTLARALHARGIVELMPTVTTRRRRLDEVVDTDHRFVSDAEFDRMASHGAFIAVGAHPGLPYRYGLPAVTSEAGLPAVILRAEHVVRVAAAAGRVPLVYQIVTSERVAVARLVARGSAAADIEARRRVHPAEICAGESVRDRVFVNDGSMAELVSRVASALREHFTEGLIHDHA